MGGFRPNVLSTLVLNEIIGIRLKLGCENYLVWSIDHKVSTTFFFLLSILTLLKQTNILKLDLV